MLSLGGANGQDERATPRDFTIKLNEKARGYRNTGEITLADPVYGTVLGRYRFATGGFGRGSAPFGRYTLGAFRGLDDDPNNIGKRWMLRGEGGKDDGEVYDPRTKDTREYIELHRARRSSGTLGCLGVLTDEAGWAEFMKNLNYLIQIDGQVGFVLEGNPAGGETIPFENVSQPHRLHAHKSVHRDHGRHRPRSRHGRAGRRHHSHRA